jgi:hypothetical protein
MQHKTPNTTIAVHTNHSEIGICSPNNMKATGMSEIATTATQQNKRMALE